MWSLQSHSYHLCPNSFQLELTAVASCWAPLLLAGVSASLTHHSLYAFELLRGGLWCSLLHAHSDHFFVSVYKPPVQSLCWWFSMCWAPVLSALGSSCQWPWERRHVVSSILQMKKLRHGMVIIAVRIRIQTQVITDSRIYVPDTAETWPQRSTADIFAPIPANFPFRFGLTVAY